MNSKPILGLTMGVATLITVMTLVQGANLYVEQKIANLGTNVFRIGRLPFAVTTVAFFLALISLATSITYSAQMTGSLRTNATQSAPLASVKDGTASGGNVSYVP